MQLRARRGVSSLAVLITVGFAVLLIIGIASLSRKSNHTFSTVALRGGPVVMTSAKDPTVIALTSHWETVRFVTSGSSPEIITTTTFNWDVWSFDAADLHRKWVTRVASIRHAQNRLDAGVLGVANGTVWVLADELTAVSVTDGHVIGDVAAIEQKNPFLKGSMPRARKELIFDDGLIIVAADGRRWRINGQTLEATLFTVGAPDALAERGETFKPLSLSSQYQQFKTRGFVVGDRWYGLVHPSEVEHLGRELIEQDFRQSLRYTFYSAPMRDTVDRFRDPYRAPKEFAPVPASPDFLLGGLLAVRDSRGMQVIGIAKPTRFIIVHQDRIDQAATQTLTCVALDGHICWEAPLGVRLFSGIERLVAGGPEQWGLLLVGEQLITAEQAASRPSDPNGDADAVLLRVGVADGRVQRMSFGEVDLAKLSKELKPYRRVK